MLRVVLAYAIVPNLPFAVAGRFVLVVRSLVNIDYLVLGALIPGKRRGLLVTGFAALLLVDLATALTPIYHFPLLDLIPSIGDVLMLASARTLPWAFLGLAAVLATAVLAVIVVAPRTARRSHRLMLLGLALAVAAADLFNGTNPYSPTNRVVVRANLATSALYRIARAAREGLRPQPRPTGGLLFSPESSATLGVLAAARGIDPSRDLGRANVGLVIIESLGLFRRPAANQAFFAPFLTPAMAERYTVRMGDVPFSGATTSGEFRELCAVVYDHRRALADGVPRCLAEDLRKLGYRTVAIHGFRRNFFNRVDWYPRIGFGRMLFAEELGDLVDRRRCGVLFRGICDSDAAAVLREELLRSPASERRFVYWLTLNSHFPVDEASARPFTYPCATDSDAARSDVLCIEMRIWRGVASSVAAIAVDPRLPPTRFVLVGDHAAPFASEAMRGLFVDNRVPYVELIPRAAGDR